MQRYSSKLLASAAGGVDKETRVYTAGGEIRTVGPAGEGGGSGLINYTPLEKNGILYFMGLAVHDYRSATVLAFGPKSSNKTCNIKLPGIAAAPVSNGRVCFDPTNADAYIINSQGSLIRHDSIDTPRASAGSTTIGYCYHDAFSKAVQILDNETIWSALNIRTTYTAATMPDMAGVVFGATAVPGVTPTAVLVPTVDIRSPTHGFLRSGSNMVFSKIAGPTGLAEVPDVQFAEYIDGRLWIGTTKGMFSTADDGTTWVQELPQSANISFISQCSDGAILAVGSGVWRGTTGVFKKVGTTTLTGLPIYHDKQNRMLFAGPKIYSEAGIALLDPAWLDTSLARGAGAYGGSYSANQVLVPDGTGSILIFGKSGAYNAFIRFPFGLYVPAASGQEVEIRACGSGGAATTAGKTTYLGALALTAGGSAASETSITNAIGSTGKRAVFESIGGGGSSSFYGMATAKAHGGDGPILINGVEYGTGATEVGVATFNGSFTPSFASVPGGLPSFSSTTRGGYGAPEFRWRGVLTDPVPMIVGQAVTGGFSESGASSQPGVVIIKEV